MLVSVFLRHSELVVVFLANAIVSPVCAWSVCAGSHGGWYDEAGPLSQSDTGFVSLSPCAAPSGTVSNSWYTLRVVKGGFRPYFRRYSYRRASHRARCLFACADSHSLHPGVGVRLSRISTSSPSGLRHEGVALSLMTSDTTVLVLHTSSYCSCTYDRSNLVHNETFIAFLCATHPH